MEIRLAHPNEFGRILEIIEEARAFLKASGSDQWQSAYPAEEDIFDDILQARGWVGLIDGEIVSYAAVIVGKEEAYEKIYDGKWRHNHPRYTVFHRVAVASQYSGQKVAQTFMQGLIEGHDGPDFRCDTHEKNTIMQHILEKLGYVYCGKVPLDGVRLAYQKIKMRSEKAQYQEIAEFAMVD
ncbi:GNAT family N-acetyltransferase [Streptococcus sp. S784/96/1]|uniref:GNAT family N-acetyltransferase n=1 Tax=Streptococcus sp. S784/96/1 TaxID=2653499 RepID=UPI001387462C|nr:GNAT family N-acetyltransferase [Streptococcus sp. S784/96/1]